MNSTAGRRIATVTAVLAAALALGAGSASAGPRESCNSLSSCNDLISSCESTRGHFTATSYDPSSGAPSSGKCERW